MEVPVKKRPRLVLGRGRYRTLHRAILKRDNWRCQSCGTRKNLQVHHLQYRSRLGDDSEQNLITLCNSCHRNIHLRK